MKLFIYKTLIVIFLAYILFEFTIGQQIKKFESKIDNLYSKQEREKIADKMKSSKSSMGTLAANISSEKMFNDENVVKVITHESLKENSFPLAKNFIRKINNHENVYHHLGIYCFETKILKKFVSFEQSENELENKLEQLRALDNNIKINVALANKSPIGVDTKEDYLAIKKIMQYK